MEDERNPAFLKTIHLPKKLYSLTERLPKPNYSPMKTKKIEKNDLILYLKQESTGKIKLNSLMETAATNNMFSDKKALLSGKKLSHKKLSKKRINSSVIVKKHLKVK